MGFLFGVCQQEKLPVYATIPMPSCLNPANMDRVTLVNTCGAGLFQSLVERGMMKIWKHFKVSWSNLK